MKMYSKSSSWITLVLLFEVLMLAGAGCVSARKEPTVQVDAARNPNAPDREKKTYTITCTSDLVQEWFISNRPALLALDEALEKLGYQEAEDPVAATYVIEAQLGFGRRPVVEKVENPDSIRYQNVAAMVGQGRYRQILTEKHDSGGSLLVGPNGETIATGGWKRLMEESEQQKDPRSPGTHDALYLRAWDVTERKTTGKVLAWEVAVLRTMDYRMPSPQHVGILLTEAAQRLAAGWSSLETVEAKSLAATTPGIPAPPVVQSEPSTAASLP